MPGESTDDLKREISRLRSNGLTVEEIKNAVDCSISTASKYQYWCDPNAGTLPPSKFSESGDDAKHEFAMRARIVTLEDAIRHAKVDLKTWYVDRHEFTSWELGYVKKDGEAQSLPLWRVKLYLKRVLPKALLDASEAIHKRLATVAPDQFTVHTTSHTGREVMATFNLFDVHFGKLGWAPECGKDNDLRITEKVFREAMAGLVECANPYNLVRSVIAVGNDYCHFDNLIGTTTSGTPMDTDGRLAKVVEVATVSMIRAIEDLLARSDRVDVLYIPGNHDKQTSYFICRELAAWFRSCDRVTVDTDPTVRKYVQWERNLIGFTHGDGARDPKSLPIIMATEKPREWAFSTCREWILGHNHTSKKFVTKDVDEHAGVIMRWVSALSGTDAWSHHNGFVNNRQAAEVYLYRKSGYHGHFVSTPGAA